MMSDLKENKNNKNKGQVMVEYLLLLIVVISFVAAAFRIIERYINFDITKCGQGSINPLCIIQGALDDGQEGANRYRSFKLMK